MKKLILALALLLSFSVFASDGGDKEKNPWQTGDKDIPTAYLPLSLDVDDCIFLSETATTKIYECDGGKVFGVFTYIVAK